MEEDPEPDDPDIQVQPRPTSHILPQLPPIQAHPLPAELLDVSGRFTSASLLRCGASREMQHAVLMADGAHALLCSAEVCSSYT